MAVRVLWLIKGLGPGGAERLLVNAAAVHDHQRFSLECAYVVPQKQHLVPALQEHGVECHCLSRRSRDLLWPVRMRRLLVRGRYDVVHFHSPLVAAAGRLVTLTLRRRDRPVRITTEHNSWATYSWPTRQLNRITARLDHRTFAVSREAAESMTGPARSTVSVLHHGIDVAATAALVGERDRVRAELGLRSDHFVVGTVANYRAQKDYPTLLGAARLAATELPGFRLVAVGQGPLAEEIATLRDQLGLGESVVLTGYRADAVRVMAAVDVFTLASRYEGLPVALMEALALGLPVAATAVGGVAEALTDDADALLCDAGDSRSLATAWRRLYEHPELRERLATASVERSADFDIRRAAKELEQAYSNGAGAVGRDPLGSDS